MGLGLDQVVRQGAKLLKSSGRSFPRNGDFTELLAIQGLPRRRGTLFVPSRGEEIEKLYEELEKSWGLKRAPGLRFQDSPQGVGLFVAKKPPNVCSTTSPLSPLVHQLTECLISGLGGLANASAS